MSKHLTPISDSSSNRDEETDVAYYRTIGGMLPIRWCAIEVLTEGRFTTKTDVWAFGVLLYEVLTWCKLPYYELDTSKLLPFLLSGGRLEMPTDQAPMSSAKEAIHELMRAAWHVDPRKRPAFTAISEYIDGTFAELLGIGDEDLTSSTAESKRRSSFKYVDDFGSLRSASSPDGGGKHQGVAENGGDTSTADLVDEEAEYQAFRAAAAARRTTNAVDEEAEYQAFRAAAAARRTTNAADEEAEYQAFRAAAAAINGQTPLSDTGAGGESDESPLMPPPPPPPRPSKAVSTTKFPELEDKSGAPLSAAATATHAAAAPAYEQPGQQGLQIDAQGSNESGGSSPALPPVSPVSPFMVSQQFSLYAQVSDILGKKETPSYRAVARGH